MTLILKSPETGRSDRSRKWRSGAALGWDGQDRGSKSPSQVTTLVKRGYQELAWHFSDVNCMLSNVNFPQKNGVLFSFWCLSVFKEICLGNTATHALSFSDVKTIKMRETRPDFPELFLPGGLIPVPGRSATTEGHEPGSVSPLRLRALRVIRETGEVYCR